MKAGAAVLQAPLLATGLATGLAILVAALPLGARAAGRAAVPAVELKVATWNLEWLTERPDGDPGLPDDAHPKRSEDISTLAGYARHLDADVVAIEEVDGPEIAARIFPPDRYRIEMTHDHVVQRVGLAIRRGLAVERHPDLVALDVAPAGSPFRLRSGLDLTIAAGGTSLRILAVHLKTGCWDRPLQGNLSGQCQSLLRQLAVLEGWVAQRRAEGVAFVIMGDFNRDLLARDPFLLALQQAAPLAQADAGHANPCWGGESFIDHILAGGPAREWMDPDSLRVMVYRETDPEMKERLSDHCAVSVRLALPG